MTHRLQPLTAAVLAALFVSFGLAGCASVAIDAPGTGAGTPGPAAAGAAARPSDARATTTADAAVQPPGARSGSLGSAAPANLALLASAAPLQPLAATQLGSADVVTLEAPPDLWHRIRRGFGMPDLEGPLVRQQEQWYSSRPDYIQRMTERSRKYLFHIVEELERRGMPSELALLPYIESAFNPHAVSSARAAGMWQFMPATGSEYELRQNIFRDDRRDVLASTRAALDYLQRLYGMFGDWHLALAAYNWGQGNVSRAIQRNQRAGRGTSYAELDMPAETRNYVPKLQAVKNIVSSPDLFRAELPLIENHPYFQTVDITRDIDVELAARLADVRLEDFKALNPSINRPVILAAGTPQILLPWDNAKVFERNFEGYRSGQYASWTAWTAPATMSVSDAARRVGMSEADFRGINNIPPRMLIRAGSVVLAPRGDGQKQDVASTVADNAQLSLAPEIVTRRTTVKARRGDSVASIAARFHVRASDVAAWNAVAPGASFKAGQAIALNLPVRTGRMQASRHAGTPALARATAAGANTPRAVARGGRAGTAVARHAGGGRKARVVAARATRGSGKPMKLAEAR